jgi:DNA-binding transcriptional regulator YbjK
LVAKRKTLDQIRADIVDAAIEVIGRLGVGGWTRARAAGAT